MTDYSSGDVAGSLPADPDQIRKIEEGLRLVRAFSRLTDPAKRAGVIALAEKYADRLERPIIDGTARLRLLLRQIADALDTPTADFARPAAAEEIEISGGELQALWRQMPNPETRRLTLMLFRRLAAGDVGK